MVHPILRSSRATFATALVFIASTLANVSAQTDWEAKVSAAGSPLTGVAFGNGTFVVSGDDGFINSSPDADTWINRASGTVEPLRSVAFGNGKFVAVGKNGVSTSSPDGVTWTPGNTGITGFASSVAFGMGNFVAVGTGGRVSLSTDGNSWTTASSGVTASFLQTIAYGNGVFIVVGARGLILRSTDGGTTWQIVTSGTTLHLQGIGASGNTFVATGQNGVMLLSQDLGQTWTRVQHGLTTSWMQSVSAGGGHFVIPGAGGTILTASTSSPTDWTEQDSMLSVDLSGSGFGAGKFVTVGALVGGKAAISTSEVNTTGLTFAAWQTQEFTEIELMDLDISGVDADPDCDGLNNLLEYAFGLAPKTAEIGTESLPKLAVVAGDDSKDYLSISFDRPIAVVGNISITLFRSTDLGIWNPVVTTTEILADDGTTQSLRLTDLTAISDAPRAYLKLRIELP